MERFYLSDLISKSQVIEKESFIKQKCKNKVVLDLGCIRHDASFANNPNWLHNEIKNVAKKVIGIDFLRDEVKKLQSLGYHILFGDVTKPLNFSEKFDVIVAGDLIEHLLNFEGFFKNCTDYLKKGGIVIITTPNPFYIDEFLYIALKKTYFVNPEHTCWMDPFTLNQLANRFNFKIQELHFIKKKWYLKDFINENPENFFDILKNKWIVKNRNKKKKIRRYFKEYLFMLVSIFYKRFTSVIMPLTNYSDYLAVLKLKSEF